MNCHVILHSRIIVKSVDYIFLTGCNVYERHFQKSNNPQGFTFNELHEKLDKANKENLSLKTRIYLLEEDQGLLGKEDEENVYRINIDLKVRTQELLQELSEKDDVLKQALGTIHILRKHLYSTKLNRNVWVLPTVEQSFLTCYHFK